jgi:predicted nucleotidyltransferase
MESVMPLRSLTSSVLKWPDREAVDSAARAWAADQVRRRPHVKRLGYFGSYASGRWGVGSDLDLVAVVTSAGEPFERRALAWDLNAIPVPAEILVYTEEEWTRLLHEGGRFAQMLMRETVWLYQCDCGGPAPPLLP